MSAHCCNTNWSASGAASPRYRKALWIALIINAVMFAVEVAGSVHSGSVSLLADSTDFAADAPNYAISLAVFSMGLNWRSRAEMVKGSAMIVLGLFVLGKMAWSAFAGILPESATMGTIGIFAFLPMPVSL